MEKLEISLSPTAINVVNEALSNGKDVQISVRNKNLIIWETQSRKKYSVVVASPK